MQKWTFITDFANYGVVLKPQKIDSSTGRILGPGSTIHFRDGQFVTDDKSIADALLAHPNFNHTSRKRGFYLASPEEPSKPAPSEEPKARKKPKSAGQDSGEDSQASENVSKADKSALIEKVCRKYYKRNLLDMAKKAGVDVTGRDTEPEVAEALIDAGIEFDIV
jgi:hypothetical protein